MFKCNLCNREFSSKQWLDYHLSKKTPCNIKLTCEICNKTFSSKQSLDRHKNKKTQCVQQIMLTNAHKCSQNDEIDNSFCEKNKLKVVKSLENDKNDKNDENLCEYCNRTFSKKSNLTRHIKHYCKNRKKILEENKELKEELEILKANSVININNTVTNNTITNNNVTNNTVNNTINNIEINAFGKEDISCLTKDILFKVIKNPDSGIPLLIKLIHFNPEYPNNQNICIKNKKDNYLDVYNGQEWEKKNQKDTIDNLIISKKDMADDFFDEQINNIHNESKIINSITQQSYENFTDAIDEYVNNIVADTSNNEKIKAQYKRLYDKLYKQVKMIIVNNNELLKIKNSN